MIGIHLDNRVCNVEKCPGTSGYEDCGYPGLFIKIFGTFKKWGNWFFFSGYHFLHESITHHEICGRRIFVQQENSASSLHSFYDVSRLGGASTGVFCRKTTSVFLIRKIIDEQRDIYIFNKTSVFGAKFQRGIVCDDVFAAVTGNMVVDAKLQGIQKRGFAMIAAAHDQSDPLRDSHAGDFAFVRKIHGDAQRFR